jgi:hypothetical protein
MQVNGSEIPSTVPLVSLDADQNGRVKATLVQATEYQKAAEAAFHRDPACIGVIAQNNAGQRWRLTWRQYYRMIGLFESGRLVEVDKWRNHHIQDPRKFALAGADNQYEQLLRNPM